jgi:hypothetical protein
MTDPHAYKLVGSYRYNPETSEFIGCVAKQEGRELSVLTIGCELSEVLILEWLRETIKLMRDTGRTDVQAADMHDRMSKSQH